MHPQVSRDRLSVEEEELETEEDRAPAESPEEEADEEEEGGGGERRRAPEPDKEDVILFKLARIPAEKICKKRYEAQGVKFAGCYIIDDSSILNRK